LVTQVVKRRVEKITAAREDAVDGKPVDRKRKAAEDSDDEPDVQDGGKGAKGRYGSKKPRRYQKRDGKPSRGGKDGKDGQDRRDGKGGRGRDGKGPAGGDDKAESKVPEKKGLEKMGAQLGSMIGRKRKSRKGGK
jgi:nucleolar protein 4